MVEFVLNTRVYRILLISLYCKNAGGGQNAHFVIYRQISLRVFFVYFGSFRIFYDRFDQKNVRNNKLEVLRDIIG